MNLVTELLEDEESPERLREMGKRYTSRENFSPFTKILEGSEWKLSHFGNLEIQNGAAPAELPSERRDLRGVWSKAWGGEAGPRGARYGEGNGGASWHNSQAPTVFSFLWNPLINIHAKIFFRLHISRYFASGLEVTARSIIYGAADIRHRSRGGSAGQAAPRRGGGGRSGSRLSGVGVTRRRRQVYVILFAVILLCSEMINTHISNTKTMYQATQDKTIQISRFMTAEHLHGVCDAYLDGGWAVFSTLSGNIIAAPPTIASICAPPHLRLLFI